MRIGELMEALESRPDSQEQVQMLVEIDGEQRWFWVSRVEFPEFVDSDGTARPAVLIGTEVK